MGKKTLTYLLFILASYHSSAIRVNVQDATDRFEPHHTEEFKSTRNFLLRNQTPISLENKKY